MLKLINKFVKDEDGASLIEYSFLVKKIVFEVSILPTIKLVSAAFIHAVVWAVVLIILTATGYPPTLTWVFAPYYFFALLALVSGLSLWTAAITPFFRDMIQVVMVGLQFAFWLTPILWSIDSVPERLARVLALNPVYYVVQGLRESLLLGRTPLAHPVLTAWFWGFVLLVNLFGVVLFRRVRPHLPDVL